MLTETIIYRSAGGIAEIRLNRPQRLNAVTQQLYDELTVALGIAEAKSMLAKQKVAAAA